MPQDAIDSFISRWENSGAAERANYQMFLSELCDILEVPRPDPTSPDPAKNLHVFDRAITRINPDGSSVTNYIDLYKARHFVCETKQGVSAPETNVASVYDRRANEKAPSLATSDIDAHRAPLQDTSSATDGTPRHALEQELLTRLVALNHERAAEEKRGLIRWLRPENQNPTAAAPQTFQATLTGTDPDSSLKTENLNLATLAWPERRPDQVAILRKVIGSGDKSVAAPYDAEALSGQFGRKNKKRTEQIEGILETLKGLGQL
jgi:hypothetical protein